MIDDEDYFKNRQALISIKIIVHGAKAAGRISEPEYESLILAVDSLHFHNDNRDAERYLTEIDRFNKIYNKIIFQ